VPNKILTFDNVDISGYVGTWQESANARINAVTVPRRHGALISDAVVQDVRQIRISGTLLSLTALGLRTILDTLTELFARQGKRLQLWDDQYITAYKSSFTWKYIEGSALCAADYSIALVCVDPFWYSTTSNLQGPTFNSMTFLDFTNHIYTQSFTLNNPGTFVAYPAYTFQMADAAVKVDFQNLTIGRRFTYAAAFGGGGTTLVIDTSGFTVNNNGVSDLIHWSGDFVWLNPGANSMQVTFTFVGVPGNTNFLLATYPTRNY
jgi:phage-related protein